MQVTESTSRVEDSDIIHLDLAVNFLCDLNMIVRFFFNDPDSSLEICFPTSSSASFCRLMISHYRTPSTSTAGRRSTRERTSQCPKIIFTCTGDRKLANRCLSHTRSRLRCNQVGDEGARVGLATGGCFSLNAHHHTLRIPHVQHRNALRSARGHWDQVTGVVAVSRPQRPV